MNLRREELHYIANNQKIADKKKADYQEGLEKSRADSAARNRHSYMKDLKKSCARSCEMYMKNQEKSSLVWPDRFFPFFFGVVEKRVWTSS